MSCGRGKALYAGGIAYEGGKKHGWGKFAFSNGQEGEFKNGSRNGMGKYKWASVNLFEGEFEEDEFNGR